MVKYQFRQWRKGLKMRDVALMGKMYWLDILKGRTHNILKWCKWAICFISYLTCCFFFCFFFLVKRPLHLMILTDFQHNSRISFSSQITNIIRKQYKGHNRWESQSFYSSNLSAWVKEECSLHPVTLQDTSLGGKSLMEDQYHHYSFFIIQTDSLFFFFGFQFINELEAINRNCTHKTKKLQKNLFLAFLMICMSAENFASLSSSSKLPTCIDSKCCPYTA